MVAERPTSADPPRSDHGQLDHWIFRDRESVEQKFGMEMERILELYETDKGKKELLERMKKTDPSLNGNIHHAMEQVNANIEQLKKKESFLKKMLMLPVRGVEAVGRTMKKHPVLTTVAGIAALIALLYFTTPLATTAGEYGLTLIDSFKSVLGKLGVPLPEVGVDAVAKVPVTGTVDPILAEEAAEALHSPGMMGEMSGEFLEAAGKSGASGVIDPLRKTLQGIPPPK